MHKVQIERKQTHKKPCNTENTTSLKEKTYTSIIAYYTNTIIHSNFKDHILNADA